MKINQLTKYQKSRISNCIFCGKPITENSEFQWCSARTGRCVAYIFIHNDCIKDAQKDVINQKYGAIKDAFNSGNTHADMSIYSTQDEELEHLDTKSWYPKMNEEGVSK